MMRAGGCNCGAVRFEVRGEPLRTGLCHCVTCRKETGSPFMAFAVWPRSRFAVAGATRSWIASTDHRHWCQVCGATLFATHDNDDEIEVRLGAFDAAPGDLAPQYELWVGRRETWLPAVADAARHAGNRDAPA